MINKNAVSSQAVNSRNKVLSGLLENEIQYNLGLKGSGQEISIMRSTLKNKGILVEKENGDTILNTRNITDDKLQNVIDRINEFVLSSSIEGGQSFDILYDELTNPRYMIGLKKGVIPIYLACVIHSYKKYIVVSKAGKELEISARLLDSINDKPSDFSIYLEKWDTDKEFYIAELTELFENYVRKTELEFSNFDYIIRAIQRWYMQLPKYAKESSKLYNSDLKSFTVDKKVRKFINAVKQAEINSREVLFEQFLKIYGYESFDKNLAYDIKESKELLDNAKNNLIEYLKCQLSNKFAKNSEGNTSLYSVILNWYEALQEETRNHMFNSIDNGILSAISEITPDEHQFIEVLSRIATGLRIEDWTDLTADIFLNTIDAFIKNISSYDKDTKIGALSYEGSYKLSFTDESGNTTYKTFNKSEYSQMGKVMLSDVESMIEEYGEAISNDEKRQILIDAINNLLS